MKKTMKLVIGYDGSPGADFAIEDLKRAGLPEHVEALVITVVDAILPPDTPGYHDTQLPRPIAESFRRSEDEARRKIGEARSLAEKCAQSLRKEFPGWTIESKAFADSPAWGILKKSEEWKAHLIVVGALGMSSPARLILGSVSQRIVTEASCSVRVVHKSSKRRSCLRIMIAVDGSAHSEKAVDEVARRQWPSGTEVRLVTVVDSKMLTALVHSESALRRWLADGDVNEREWVERLAEANAKKLRDHDLKVTHWHAEGTPKSVLLEEAKKWKADCIFVGARGLSGLKHFLIGSVSAAVAARAHCTVEVVRDESTTHAA